jgi:serine/threonine protein kinase
MQVVHADVAARNVLLTSDQTAKLTDFGLSRRLYEYTQYVKKNQEPLPWRWMAIESLQTMQFSTESDVWSYGITVWEIFSLGDIPYPGLSWNLEFVGELERGLRMNKPKYATSHMYES